MHTEAEAKTKWCPMARVSINAAHYFGGNRFEFDGPPGTASRLDGSANCIASACMMWRKGPRAAKRYFVTYQDKPEEEWNWNPTNSKGYEGTQVRIVEGDDYGFCGLAGRADHT